jgi:HK97 family phage portal protein
MAFLDFFRKSTVVPMEFKQAPSVHMQQTSPFHNRSDNFKSYAVEGYQQNAIVYRCVNEIAQGAASINFKVFQGDIELEVHPLISLLSRPNPLQAGNEYFQSLYSYLLLSGNSYAISSTANNLPTELHLLRPDRVEIVPSNTSIPKGYNYKLNGKIVQSYDADPFTGQSDVKHFKMWNPMDDYLGLSPLMAASIDIDQHNLIAKHNIALLVNGARPTGAVIFKPTDTSGKPMMMNDMQRKQVQSDLDRKTSGTNNSGKPLLLEGDFDWKEMGMSPRDMDFLQNKHMAAKDIALCFGIPSQLIGIPDSQTYANVQEARLALYEETIIPLSMRVCSDLNEWLAPSFGDDIRIEYDIDSIPAMTERRRRVYENVTSAVREGIISRNEARDRLGLGPINGGDEVFIAANLFPLGSPEVAPPSDAEEAGKSAYGEEKLEQYPDGADVPDELPSAYRMGTGEKRCGNCDYYEEGSCTLFDADVRAQYVCNAWKEELEQSSKAESDVDTVPTEAMAINGQRALDMRKEFGRGMTRVGVARANQLINRERLSPNTVRRMKSFFARHEVDKQGQGFNRGEAGYPSAGKIAWLGWGGDEGQSWANRKVDQLDKERDKSVEAAQDFGDWWDEEIPPKEDKAPISEAVKKALAEKVKEHNEKHGNKKGKKVTQRMLEAVFSRGVGAYNTNPQSVRPTVTGPDQWAYARVNVFLAAVRTGRFKSGKFDTDLLPEGHPLKAKK